MAGDELTRLAARGALAGAVTGEMARPLAQVAETLGALVDRLDRHVSEARGPEPLGWNAVGELRERLAELFLDMGRIRRLAHDLALVAAPDRGARHPEACDVNELVERALSLSRHRVGEDQEVLLDLGSLPLVEVDAVRLVQALAHLISDAAAIAGPGATLAVKTAPAGRESVIVSLAHPGAPGESIFAAFVRDELAAEGREFAYTAIGDLATASLTLCVAK